jgi:hypothetical protein
MTVPSFQKHKGLQSSSQNTMLLGNNADIDRTLALNEACFSVKQVFAKLA